MHKENIVNNKNSDFVKTPEENKVEIKKIGRNNTRPNKIRKYSDTIKWNDINFPPPAQDYVMLEKNNANIALNVFEIDDEKRLRYIYHSTLDRKDRVNLILLEKKHLCLS